MKHIKKGAVPHPLREWIKANKFLPDAEFGSHGFPKDDVRRSLLDEQGFVCAYTMTQISAATCHIEHIKPQEQSRQEKLLSETWDYKNLLACYPGDDPSAPGRGEFGATKKGSEWSATQFVSPLAESCEKRFRFLADGTVTVSQANDSAAKWTLETLKLDSEVLDDWRRAAIEAFGVSLTSPSPLNRSDAERLRAALRKRRADGSFFSYSVVLEQVAEDYLSKLNKIDKARQFAKRSQATKGG